MFGLYERVSDLAAFVPVLSLSRTYTQVRAAHRVIDKKSAQRARELRATANVTRARGPAEQVEVEVEVSASLLARVTLRPEMGLSRVSGFHETTGTLQIHPGRVN